YVYNRSRINLCTHVRRNGDMYINERVCQILGSRSLLLVDKTNGIEKIIDDECCEYLNENDPIQQIELILSNYEKYDKKKENGYNYAIKFLTWKNWAETINNGIMYIYDKHKFSKLVPYVGKKNPVIRNDMLKILYMSLLLIHTSYVNIGNIWSFIQNNILSKNNIDIN